MAISSKARVVFLGMIALVGFWGYSANVCGQSPGDVALPYYGAFRELPITDVTPEGWLAEFLQRQREGLALHHDASGFPFDTCLWAGVIPRTGWGRYEQAAYLVDGLYRCGLLTGDKTLTDLGTANVRYVLDHPQADGKLGPGPDEIGLTDEKEKGDQWPFAVFSRAMMAYHDVTGDRAMLDAMTKHYLALPADFGRARRDADNIEGICWLYGQTGNAHLATIAERTWANFTRSPDSQWNLDKMKQESPMHGHSSSIVVTTQQPALLYLATGKKEYLDAVVGAYHALARDHELLDGATSHDETTHGLAPEGGHDVGVISDYAWSLGYIYEASGDAVWGDKIERAVFNAGLGAVDKDFKSMECYSAPNQVIATQRGSVPAFAPVAERQGFRPGYSGQTSTGDIQRLLPNFAGRLWMSDGKGGLGRRSLRPQYPTCRGWHVRDSGDDQRENRLSFFPARSRSPSPLTNQSLSRSRCVFPVGPRVPR